jgi:hypothetical protein
MLGPAKVLGGVLVLGGIATSHVPAFRTQAQLDPGVTGLNTVFADVDISFNDLQVAGQMRTNLCHRGISYAAPAAGSKGNFSKASRSLVWDLGCGLTKALDKLDRLCMGKCGSNLAVCQMNSPAFAGF